MSVSLKPFYKLYSNYSMFVHVVWVYPLLFTQLILSFILTYLTLPVNVCVLCVCQELKESQKKQQAALEKLRGIKEDKRRELIRRKEQEEERRRREEERKRQEEERKRKDEEEAQRYGCFIQI